MCLYALPYIDILIAYGLHNSLDADTCVRFLTEKKVTVLFFYSLESITYMCTLIAYKMVYVRPTMESP